MAALEGATVDVQLSGVDQKSTTAGAVAGELTTLVNARVRKFTAATDAAGASQERIRVEKREGFTRLSQNIRTPTTGNFVSSASIPNASLLATRQDQPLAINSSAQAYVYEPEQPAWEVQDAYQLTNKLTRTPVYTPNAQISMPQGQSIGNVFMYVWTEGTVCKGLVCDKDGTIIRSPFTIQSAGRIKLVSDGVRFWVVTDAATTTASASVFDTNGALVATGFALAPLRSATTPWDIQAMPGTGNGIVFASNTSSGVDYARIAFATWTGGTVVITGPLFDQYLPMTYGVSFLRSDDPSHIYIATSSQFVYVPPGPDPTRNRGLYVGKLNLDGSHNALIPLITTLTEDQAKSVANLTGYASAAGDVSVSATFLNELAGPTIGDSRNNQVWTISVPAGGSPSSPSVKRSVSLASKAFVVGTRNVAVVYYSSQQSALDVAFGLTFRQATFFLLDLVTQHIVGRFEYGTAAADWIAAGWIPAADSFPPNSFQLPTPFTDSASGIHVSLGYRATSQASRYASDATARMLAISAAPLVSWLPQLFQQFTNTIGVLDITLRAEHGKAVEFNELLLPGAVATSWSGQDFGESNFNLAPERPIAITTGGGGLTPNQTYQLCVVWEWTNAAGQRVKSAPSPPLSMVMGADTEINATLYTLRVTEHANVMASVYMTYMVNGLMSTTFAKATDDLTPTYNSTTADTIQWDSGTLTDDQIAVGEPLYTDGNPGHLPNYPLPPFSQGCQAWNRVFVIGPDGAVWFTFEDDEVSALAGNPAFRILPPNEPFTRVVNMDAFLLIGSEKRWYILERGNLPDSTGAGTIPTPAVLPFPNGVTGAVQVTREGCFYGSSTGGIWMITRDLQNVYVGAKAEDMTSGMTIADMTTDKDQNVIASVVGGFVVWDPVSRTWGKWSLPGTTRTFAIDASDAPAGSTWVFVNGDFTDIDIGGTVTPAFDAPNTAFNIPYTITDVLSSTTVTVTPTPAGGFTNPATGNTITVTRPDIAPLLATWRGRLMFSDADRVWVQTADSYADIEGATEAAIITTFSTAPIHLGGVKNFKRLWDQQIFGEYYGDHDLTVTVTYDDTTTPVVSTYEFTPDGSAPYQYQLPVTVELCTSVAFTFTDSFPRTVSRGFSLELISFYVGLEKGLARVPIARRIAPTG